MRTFVLLALVACLAVTSAIPVENPGEGDSSKYLKDVVRTKRGWGYEPIYTHTSFVPSPEIHTTVLGPSKTIITAAHPPVHQTTSVVTVPHTRVYSYAPATQSESIVWQSGPDHSYVVHQRHSPRTYYYYTPTTTTHLLNHGPVIAW